MPIAITCPECAIPFKVPDADAEKMARCPRCQCPVEPRHPKVAADAIQVTSFPARSTRKTEEDDDDFAQPTRHGTPRSPFPWSALYIVTIGILFFLLAFSAGFNAWFLSKDENPFQMNNEAIRRQQAEAALQAAQQAEAMAREQAERAEKNAVAAREQLAQAEKNEADARRERDELRKELDRTRMELEDLKRRKAAPPDPEMADVLEGRVIWLGEMPKMNALDPALRIDPKTRGVANVAVFIKRPKDGKLPIHANAKINIETIVIDAFVPYVATFFPKWDDGTNRGETGQAMMFRNSSALAQNVRATGHPKYNNQFNKTLMPKAEFRATFDPQPLPVFVQSDLHPRMKAIVWVFDHPYFAITKADGTFSIPRVPAGMEVQVMAWHESQGWLLTKEGRTMQLKKGKNTLNLTMGADNDAPKK